MHGQARTVHVSRRVEPRPVEIDERLLVDIVQHVAELHQRLGQRAMRDHLGAGRGDLVVGRAGIAPVRELDRAHAVAFEPLMRGLVDGDHLADIETAGEAGAGGVAQRRERQRLDRLAVGRHVHVPLVDRVAGGPAAEVQRRHGGSRRRGKQRRDRRQGAPLDDAAHDAGLRPVALPELPAEAVDEEQHDLFRFRIAAPEAVLGQQIADPLAGQQEMRGRRDVAEGIIGVHGFDELCAQRRKPGEGVVVDHRPP